MGGRNHRLHRPYLLRTRWVELRITAICHRSDAARAAILPSCGNSGPEQSEVRRGSSQLACVVTSPASGGPGRTRGGPYGQSPGRLLPAQVKACFAVTGPLGTF